MDMPARCGTEEPDALEPAAETQPKEPRAPQPTSPPSSQAEAFLFGTLHEVNERCIELLVNAARADERPPFALVAPLREMLIPLSPKQRRRAAEIGFLLVDMEFHDPRWWIEICRHPDRQWRTGKWRGQFPRRSAIPLTHDTLTLVWHSVQADRDTACALLGLARPVAELISTLKLSEIHRIAVRRARHIYPRWYDQPLVWRSLLLAASGGRSIALRNFQIQGLQLMGGMLLAALADESVHPEPPLQTAGTR
jgi:hypothetical protein